MTKQELREIGWIFQNGAYRRENLLLKKANNEIVIIRMNGNYPTVFAGTVKDLEHFKQILKEHGL